MDLTNEEIQGGLEQLEVDLETSCTLYIGNLSFYTTEEQIYELFSKCGEVKRIIMGLDRLKKTPCGFCFVEYYYRQNALDCMKFLNGTKLDERIIRTDIDPGFKAGRQFGRGKAGGQVRDEKRKDYDEGRGGWGAAMLEDDQREVKQREVYKSATDAVPTGSSDFFTNVDSSNFHQISILYFELTFAFFSIVDKKRGRGDDGQNDGDLDEFHRTSRFRKRSPDMDE